MKSALQDHYVDGFRLAVGFAYLQLVAHATALRQLLDANTADLAKDNIPAAVIRRDDTVAPRRFCKASLCRCSFSLPR